MANIFKDKDKQGKTLYCTESYGERMCCYSKNELNKYINNMENKIIERRNEEDNDMGDDDIEIPRDSPK